VAERLYTTLITCHLDGHAHNVTDESVAAGREAGGYEALCDHRIVPAPMIAPVGERCPGCTAVLAPQEPDPAPPRVVDRGTGSAGGCGGSCTRAGDGLRFDRPWSGC